VEIKFRVSLLYNQLAPWALWSTFATNRRERLCKREPPPPTRATAEKRKKENTTSSNCFN
jgi:hypothetical protein